jgi:putative spermidine/putrescine transport system substrate-binding protein
VNQDKAIAEKFKADTGITIQYVAVTTDDVTKRAVTAPNSFDLIDTEYFSLKKIVPTGNLKGIDTKRIKNADKITSLFTKGEVAGKKVGDQGTAPKKVIYLEGEKSKKFSATPTQFMTLIPTVYNADTLGIRPDLIKRPITSLGRAAEPRVQGQGRDPQHPLHRHHGRGDGGRGHGQVQVPRQGQHDQEGDRPHDRHLIEAKKAGQFRALWKDFNESVNLMASGEVVIQSMWSPAVTAVRTKGIACNFQPLKEGYRAWAAGFGVPATLSARSSMAPTSSSTGSSTAGPAPT